MSLCLTLFQTTVTLFTQAMAELLDPTREYFGSRIIAQGAPAAAAAGGAGSPDDIGAAAAAPAPGGDTLVVKRLTQVGVMVGFGNRELWFLW